MPRDRFVVFELTARSIVRSGGAWGVGFGAYIALSAYGFAATYRTASARARLAQTFGSSSAIDALMGPAHHLDSVTGFTAWRSLGVLSVAGAIWGLLAATRLLRGEEDSGRWELLLAGGTTRRSATAQALAGAVVGLGAMWLAAAAIIVACGRSSTFGVSVPAAAFLALAMVAAPSFFLAVGAMSSQLAATRRQAAAIAGGVLAASFALRMLADSTTSLAWLRWASPLGWVEELRPLTGSRGLAVVPIVAGSVAATAGAVWVSGHLDLRGSVLNDRTRAQPRTRMLSGPVGLELRVDRGVILGWTAAVAAMALVLGLVARSAGASITTSSTVADVLAKLGAHGGGAEAYLGLSFLVIAMMAAAMASGQVTHAYEEESSGRLDHLTARTVSRRRWLTDRLALAAAIAAVEGLTAGLCTWVGAAIQHTGVSFGSLLGAGANVVAPSLATLGVGALALGAAPRRASAITYAFLGWAIVIDMLGGFVSLNHWVLDTSVFHHLVAAPAASPDWRSAAMLAAVGVAASAVGISLFLRRDLGAP